MPPASKKFFAKLARAVKSDSLPRLARKTFGRAPRSRQDAVGRVAQAFERLGEADARQGLGGHRHGGLLRRDDCRDIEDGRRRFVEIGKIAGPGERVLAARDGLLALRPHGRDLALDQTRSSAAQAPPAASIS